MEAYPLSIKIHCCSVAKLRLTPWPRQGSLCFTISQSLLRLKPIESVMPSNHLILCRPLLLLPSVFPSIRVFSSEVALRIRQPKYWSFSISPFNEYSGLISFRLTAFIILQSKELSGVFSSTTVWKHHFFGAQKICGKWYLGLGQHYTLKNLDCGKSRHSSKERSVGVKSRWPFVA